MLHERISKIISHALRHDPEKYGIRLTENGWVEISELINGIKKECVEYQYLTQDDVMHALHESIKKRHEISGTRIRALHGHSIHLNLQSEKKTPPIFLFHATSKSKGGIIKTEGLLPMERQYVHLATTEKNALDVAKKKYTEIVLFRVNALEANARGIDFYNNNKSEDVWMCPNLPAEFLSIIEG